MLLITLVDIIRCVPWESIALKREKFNIHSPSRPFVETTAAKQTIALEVINSYKHNSIHELNSNRLKYKHLVSHLNMQIFMWPLSSSPSPISNDRTSPNLVGLQLLKGMQTTKHYSFVNFINFQRKDKKIYTDRQKKYPFHQ